MTEPQCHTVEEHKDLHHQYQRLFEELYKWVAAYNALADGIQHVVADGSVTPRGRERIRNLLGERPDEEK